MKHNILVTGGNGFVGSQVVTSLVNDGHEVTVVDLQTKKHSLPVTEIISDYSDFFVNNRIKYDTVIHLAAEHIVPHSIAAPAKYYLNNVVKMKNMLDSVVAIGIKNIVFSSSGNIYGRQGANGLSLSEDAYYDPENPYASTKVAGEMLIKDYARAYGLNFINFRFFNAAGADPAMQFGYTQRPATHVIPILCNKIIQNEPFTIYGSNYDTTDGTCIRDYVHIVDIARAHQRALDLFDKGPVKETINLGGGSNGVSVLALVDHISKMLNVTPLIQYADKREGDPAILIANISKASKILNWKPMYDIKDIIRHAWNWEQK